MDLDGMTIRVHPGGGLVARFPGVALVLLDGASAGAAVADELLRLVEASASTEAAPGRRLARQVARLLGDRDPDEVPSFGLLAQAEHGVALVLHGSADAHVTTAKGDEHLSGRQVATWLDRILAPPVSRIEIVPSDRELQPPDARFRLNGGVVPGGGLSASSVDTTAVPTDSPAAPESTPAQAAEPAMAMPEPASTSEEPEAASEPDATKIDMQPAPRATMGSEPVPVEPMPFTSVLLMDAEPEEVREPLPVAGEAPVEEEPAGTMVKGVICSRGHFNDPAAPFCGVCGISMVQKTLNLVDGPRPPLGVIVFDDGATFSVDTDYVLGREPDADPDVVSGKARPLMLSDPDRTVSRVHSALVLRDWNVRVVDRNSANGTYIAAPGQEDWSQVPPNQPTTITPGTRIRLGQRVLLYDSHGGKR